MPDRGCHSCGSHLCQPGVSHLWVTLVPARLGGRSGGGHLLTPCHMGSHLCQPGGVTLVGHICASLGVSHLWVTLVPARGCHTCGSHIGYPIPLPWPSVMQPALTTPACTLLLVHSCPHHSCHPPSLSATRAQHRGMSETLPCLVPLLHAPASYPSSMPLHRTPPPCPCIVSDLPAPPSPPTLLPASPLCHAGGCAPLVPCLHGSRCAVQPAVAGRVCGAGRG